MAFLGMIQKLGAKNKNPPIRRSAWEKMTIKSKKRNNNLAIPIVDGRPRSTDQGEIDNTVVTLAKYVNRQSQKMKYRSSTYQKKHNRLHIKKKVYRNTPREGLVPLGPKQR